MPEAAAFSTTPAPAFDPFAFGGKNQQDPFALGGCRPPEFTSAQSLLIRKALSLLWCAGRSPKCTVFVISLPNDLAAPFIDDVLDKVDFDDFEPVEADEYDENALLFSAAVRHLKANGIDPFVRELPVQTIDILTGCQN
jgi:hypothetical protein